MLLVFFQRDYELIVDDFCYQETNTKFTNLSRTKILSRTKNKIIVNAMKKFINKQTQNLLIYEGPKTYYSHKIFMNFLYTIYLLILKIYFNKKKNIK